VLREGEGGDDVFWERSDFGFGFGFGFGGILGGNGFLPPSAGWSRDFVGSSAGGCSAGRDCSAVAAGTGLD
jgi:hypothetical protein